MTTPSVLRRLLGNGVAVVGVVAAATVVAGLVSYVAVPSSHRTQELVQTRADALLPDRPDRSSSAGVDVSAPRTSATPGGAVAAPPADPANPAPAASESPAPAPSAPQQVGTTEAPSVAGVYEVASTPRATTPRSTTGGKPATPIVLPPVPPVSIAPTAPATTTTLAEPGPPAWADAVAGWLAGRIPAPGTYGRILYVITGGDASKVDARISRSDVKVSGSQLDGFDYVAQMAASVVRVGWGRYELRITFVNGQGGQLVPDCGCPLYPTTRTYDL